MQTICAAIVAKKLIHFHYSIADDPGYRTVEPHMVAYTKDNNLALSAWYLSGASASNEGQTWRIYLLEGISQVQQLTEGFDGPRTGYRSDGGKSFPDVQCGL